MPYKEPPKFTSPADKLLEVPQPGIGGLNLFDLEFEQNVNQTPDMLNMMYRNGTFGKRYGQDVYKTFSEEIYALFSFNGKEIVHSGDKIYVDGKKVAEGIEREVGRFIRFGDKLYYHVGETIYEYKMDNYDYLWIVMEPYVPDVFINCEPKKDGHYDVMDEYNLLTLKFNTVYNADGTATKFYAYGTELKIINWDIDPIVKVDDELKVKGTDFTVNATGQYIEFTTAPAKGSANVEVIYTMKVENLRVDRERLLNCKYFNAYGANGNSRLFMGGGGASKIFYSESYDATYFPENNWILIGSTEDDVTAFGLQYNVLLVFKPKEIYSLYSYQTTASMVTTDEQEKIGVEAFSSTIVNSRVGCDVPHSMQLVNNQLTWMNSNEGICTLVSTSISDERNVRVISRNINRTNNMGVKGLLDYKEDLTKIQSADFDDKYFIVLPESGMCFMWDYAISPFVATSSRTTDPKDLDWYLFDNFFVRSFAQLQDTLYFISNKSLETYYPIVKLSDSLSDFDYENYKETPFDIRVPISAHYMTSLNEYNAVEQLKTINNIYVQCRADKPTVINLSYITEESPYGEVEPEPIRVTGKLWEMFSWSNFAYDVINFVNTFRRRCSIKKIQVLGVRFWNDELDNDMSISHLAFQYRIVKFIK